MILVITHKTDFTADFIINKLNQRNIPYKRFNCEDILKYDCSIRFEPQPTYSILEESRFDSVLFRRTKFPILENMSISDVRYIASEIDSFLKNLFTILHAKWISFPYAVYEAENKLLQLKCANQLGFEIPKTLITNSKNELIEFYNECNQDIIIKPISNTRIEDKNSLSLLYTSYVSLEDMSNLSDYDLTPCIFQENIKKDVEIRVTVVGQNVFAASVNSQEHSETKIDWRRKRLLFNEIFLPSKIQSRCIELVRKLDLEFGAIDLIRTPDNKYVFLEINPNGQWAWIENQTGQKISEALINNLLN